MRPARPGSQRGADWVVIHDRVGGLGGQRSRQRREHLDIDDQARGSLWMLLPWMQADVRLGFDVAQYDANVAAEGHRGGKRGGCHAKGSDHRRPLTVEMVPAVIRRRPQGAETSASVKSAAAQWSDRRFTR